MLQHSLRYAENRHDADPENIQCAFSVTRFKYDMEMQFLKCSGQISLTNQLVSNYTHKVTC